MFSTPVPEEMLRGAAEAAGYRHDRGVRQCVRQLYLDPNETDRKDIAELLRGFRVEAQLRGRDIHPFLPSPDSLPNGGVPVARIPQKICRHFSGRPGWAAEIEMRLTWKHVDVGVRTPAGAFHAYEVVNQNLEKEKSNFEKDVRDGWQIVCFCVGTAETRNDLRHLLIQAFGEAPIRKHAEFAYLPDFR